MTDDTSAPQPGPVGPPDGRATDPRPPREVSIDTGGAPAGGGTGDVADHRTVDTVAATDRDLTVPPPASRPIHVEPTADPAGVLAVPDLAAAGVAVPLVDVTDEGDTAFAAEALDEETLHFGEPAPAPLVCQWCNAPLSDAGAEVCPHCGGRLQPVDETIVVPGVTTLPAEALEAELRLRRRIADAAASASARALGETPPVPPVPPVLPPVQDGDPVFRPPSDEVARLMREMELEARLAQVEREVPDEVLAQAEAAAAAERSVGVEPGGSPVADEHAVPGAVSDERAIPGPPDERYAAGDEAPPPR